MRMLNPFSSATMTTPCKGVGMPSFVESFSHILHVIRDCSKSEVNQALLQFRILDISFHSRTQPSIRSSRSLRSEATIEVDLLAVLDIFGGPADPARVLAGMR